MKFQKALLLFLLILFVAFSPAYALTFGPDFAADYTAVDLGSVPGVPPLYGGLTLLSGSTSTLLIGGNANTDIGALYSIGLSRDGSSHISGFVGIASLFASAPYNDGGVTYGPGGVLFASRWPVNELGQYEPGSATPDKVIDLAPLGVEGSHSAINFVPAGFGGAGEMKLVTYGGGKFYTADFSPDGSGTFDITAVTLEETLPGGPEGFVYVGAGSPGFLVNGMLISEYAAGTVGAYEVDADGNPILATRRDFITDLAGAEGAFIDPLTGDFLFSRFGGGDKVFSIRGFLAPDPSPTVVPEPTTVFLLGLGAFSAFFSKKRLFAS